MKNSLLFLALLFILVLFVGCGSTKITQKDIFSEIKQKGKYKNPRKIDVVNEISLYKADSLFQKMTKIEFDTLQLKGFFYFEPLAEGIFYYAFEERKEYYMLFIFGAKKYYTHGIDIIVYNKNWKIINSQELSENGGDGGFVWHKKCDFLDENTFDITSEQSYGGYTCEKLITQYKINPNGQIDSLSTKYIIKRNQEECMKEGEKNINEMNKK